VDLTIDSRNVAFHRLAPEPSSVELITAEEARTRLPAIHARIAPSRPGFFHRSQVWWEERFFSDHSSRRRGRTSLRYAVAEDDRGYVLYRQKANWEDGHGAGEVFVEDLMADTAPAWAGLWSLVLSHDLVVKVTAEVRPPDDPLFDLLAAPRRAQRRPHDGLWVRLIDPLAALSARRYESDGRLTMEIADGFYQRTTTVELAVEEGSGQCRPVGVEPDLRLDLEDLSSCYMGRTRFRELACTGRVKGSTEALTLADRLFEWHPGPWCPEIF
jgi:predicted acetyltransferase